MRAAGRIVLGIFAAALGATAAEADIPYARLAVEAPLPLTRGTLLPGSPGAERVAPEDHCDFVRGYWGWKECEGVDAIVFGFAPDVSVLVVWRPASGGLVRMDDWTDPGRHAEIARIERERRQTLGEQSLRLNLPIEYRGWRAYPTLNEAQAYLYFGHSTLWDGAPHTMIHAGVLDRRGHVLFQFVPYDHAIEVAGIERMIEDVLARYRPARGEEYGAFRPGDRVAETGAIALLADMLGVAPPAAEAEPGARGRGLWILATIALAGLAIRFRR